jgi:phosphoketolase
VAAWRESRASIDEGISPDVVLVGIGDNLMLEVMAAAQILRNEMPELFLLYASKMIMRQESVAE